ncbi:hypothetical protein EV127DRAFT_408531 [Xylaria flabelliformis]|nr:hypothetical protein EV127DRAFT_408531 [Xylaria flabelliformis]
MLILALTASVTVRAMESDDMGNTESEEASQNSVDLFLVYPAKIFHDLWKRSVQPRASYKIIMRTRIYDSNGDAMWMDFNDEFPLELQQWGSETLPEQSNLHDSNESALLVTHRLLVKLRDYSFHPVVKHEVHEDGCIHLRVNFGPKSYFTVRVHNRSRNNPIVYNYTESQTALSSSLPAANSYIRPTNSQGFPILLSSEGFRSAVSRNSSSRHKANI